MNAPRSLILALILALTGCATPIAPALDCASPPKLPEVVQKQADQQRPTYSERGKPLLEFFETQILTAPR